jgi:iron complex outermembrane recepter protein
MRIVHASFLMASILSTTSLATTAEAQTTTGEVESTIGLEEIVVTAERREVNLQKSSITIQVIGPEDLQRTGLSSPTDLGKLTTGVEIGTGGENAQIYIRGVGSFAFSPLASPGVAFNVDGVYVGRPDSVNGNFYDIARVEVLKGPQGTLYGRNANGGAINVISNEPILGTFGADLNVEAGNYALKHTSGAVNLPVGDTAALRVAFNVMDRKGYLSDGTDDDVQQAGRVRFKWAPSEVLSLLLNADYIHIGGKGSNAVWLPQRPGSNPYEATTEPAANAYKLSFPTVAPFSAFTTPAVNDAYVDSNFYNLSAQLDANLGFAKLTVLPAFRNSEPNYRSWDIGGLIDVHEKSEQSSLEVRLGNNDSPLAWVVGGYAFNEKQNGSTILNNGDTPVPFLGNTVLQDYRILYTPQTKAYAAFGQLTAEVKDGLRLIAGARYTYEEATNGGSISDISVTPAVLKESFPGEKNFDGFTYKIGAEYDLTPRSMLYTTYSTGFKAGGFSQTVAPENVYQPEKLYALELGSKNRFLDNRVQVNLSLFDWKYKDLQDSRVNFDPLGQANFITFNSGDATIYGATLDLVARITPADTFGTSVEYAHSKYDSFVINTPAPLFQPGSIGCPVTLVGGIERQDCTGFQVARVPTWSATASYNHVVLLPNQATITAGANTKYTGSRWLGIDFTPAERGAAYALVDADLTYGAPTQRWSVGLFGRNLTDHVYYTGGIQAAFIAGLFAANIGAPRTYGVQGSVKF